MNQNSNSRDGAGMGARPTDLLDSASVHCNKTNPAGSTFMRVVRVAAARMGPIQRSRFEVRRSMGGIFGMAMDAVPHIDALARFSDPADRHLENIGKL